MIMVLHSYTPGSLEIGLGIIWTPSGVPEDYNAEVLDEPAIRTAERLKL